MTTPVSASLATDRIINLYARWTPVTYKVHYERNGAEDGADMDDSIHTYDDFTTRLTVNTFTNSPLEFRGWAKAQDSTQWDFADNDNVKENLSNTQDAVVPLYAVWAAPTYNYTVIYKTNDGTEAVYDTKIITYPATTVESLPEPPAAQAGYDFGWTLNQDGTGGAFDATTTVNANITVWAQWTLINYNITYNLNGGTNGNLATYTIESGEITLQNPVRGDYPFEGWYDNNSYSGNAVSVIPASSTGAKEFWAKWGTPSLSGSVSIDGLATRKYRAKAPLTVTTSGLNGQGDGALSYVWKRNNTAIDGATAATYPLGTLDIAGAQITVTVSRAGYDDTTTSGVLTVQGYTVGETGPAGGKIFYVHEGGTGATFGYDPTQNVSGQDTGNGVQFPDGTGWRYLEASPNKLFEGTLWGPAGGLASSIVKNDDYTSANIGKGKWYTAKIIAALGTGTSYAAHKCDAYTLNDYDDWFLPSAGELNEMRQHIDLYYAGNCRYWSSNDRKNDAVWILLFASGAGSGTMTSGISMGDGATAVRAVRAF